MKSTQLVATLNTSPAASGVDFAALGDVADWLEVRADLTGDLSPATLRRIFRGRLLYTLRSRAEGGQFADSDASRRDRLLSAAPHYDLVALESRDLIPEILNRIPPRQRLISWHGGATETDSLARVFDRLSVVPASYYKLVSAAQRAGDGVAPLRLLKSLGRNDIIAYAAGTAGFWSRLVAPQLGSPLLFGTLGNGPSDGAEPSIEQLVRDYGFPALTPVEAIYGIVGAPVAHSLSPRLHNAAYRALEHPALFVPFHADSFAAFWRDFVETSDLAQLGIPLRGVTVASPNKEDALTLDVRRSDLAARAGSANVLCRANGGWKADTTDPDGVLINLRVRSLDVRDKRAAVVGCGGSGRAIAAALVRAGAQVTLVNRGRERGRRAVDILGLPFVPLAEFRGDGFAVIVNATPVGRDGRELPFPVARLNDQVIVIDLVYGVRTTPLIAAARACGSVAIDGRDVLLAQVQRQFKMMTGQEISPGLAESVV